MPPRNRPGFHLASDEVTLGGFSGDSSLDGIVHEKDGSQTSEEQIWCAREASRTPIVYT